ncbi:tellurite resistance TerB C-terminal domain-containing protein [Faecalibaculum rodentium]
MPSVVTDAINEALFDEIGDNAMECEGEDITLVEDYREDVMDILGGMKHE